MNKYFYILLFFLFNLAAKAQELNAKVTINSSKIQSADKQGLADLETKLTQLLNETKWTDATFAKNERIACTFTITLSSISGFTYSGDVQITSQRPVFNSSYTTSLLNFKDENFIFDYNREELLFNKNNISSNLVAMMAFYSYIIIGLDSDSFALDGGRNYYSKAMDIANSSQSFNIKGWKPFDSDRNRYALILALTEETSSFFHSIWYNYHRLGLDVMSANVDGGRTKIEQTLPDLDKFYEVRRTSVLLSIFADCKLDEIINIYNKATLEEKQDAEKILEKIYPTKTNQVKRLTSTINTY